LDAWNSVEVEVIGVDTYKFAGKLKDVVNSKKEPLGL